MKTYRQIALDAATALEKIGWCQGQFSKKDEHGDYDGFCAVGAVRYATGAYAQDVWDRRITQQGYRAAHATVRKINMLMRDLEPEFAVDMAVDESPLVNFNDMRGQTQAGMIDLFRRAAEMLPEEEPRT